MHLINSPLQKVMSALISFSLSILRGNNNFPRKRFLCIFDYLISNKQSEKWPELLPSRHFNWNNFIPNNEHSAWHRVNSNYLWGEWRKNISGTYLICHDGGHGPANLMVLLTFPYWTQQDKQKSGNTHKGGNYVSKIKKWHLTPL